MLIGEIAKNSTEKIRVTLSEYKGHTFIDVRVYYEDDTGEWRPTKKGIAIAPDKVDELIRLLRKHRRPMNDNKGKCRLNLYKFWNRNRRANHARIFQIWRN